MRTNTLIVMCILLVSSGCMQITSNSRMEIEDGKVTIYDENKANIVGYTLEGLKGVRWGEFSLQEVDVIPQDAEFEFDFDRYL
jgi:hypothetical protein